MMSTVWAEYRQLIGQHKNLCFGRRNHCAIVSLPATVPSRFTAGYDKTCYPSPKGRSRPISSGSPFFLCRAADRTMRAFLRIVVLIESAPQEPIMRRDNAKCGANYQNTQPFCWQRPWRPVQLRTQSAPVWALLPVAWPWQRLAGPLLQARSSAWVRARCATISGRAERLKRSRLTRTRVFGRPGVPRSARFRFDYGPRAVNEGMEGT